MQGARLISCVLTILFYAEAAYSEDYVLTDPGLKEAVSEYELAVSVARDKFLPHFEKAITVARNNNAISVDERAKLISELESQRERFLVDGTVPVNAVLMKFAQPYGRSVDQAASKLSVPFKKAAKTCIDKGKVSEATALLKYLDKTVIGDGYELVGHWRLAEGIGAHGFSEQYVIQKRLGQWAVDRSFYTPSGEKVGASTAIDLVYADSVLSYTDHFTRKPKAEWHDKATMKVWVDDKATGTLKMSWVVGSGQSDQNTLVPVN